MEFIAIEKILQEIEMIYARLSEKLPAFRPPAGKKSKKMYVHV